MSVLIFIFVLLVLVVGHEFGHFVMAKIAKMKVLEFGIGFPPKIWGRKVGETEYTINWLPFGGFVKIFGEDENDDGPEAMYLRSKLSQAIVIAAGPLMNILMGFLLISFAYMVGVPAIVPTGSLRDDNDPTVTNTRVIVEQILPKSPAAVAGLKVGDEIVSVHSPEELQQLVQGATSALTLTITRDGKTETITVTPRSGIVPDEKDRKAIGVASTLIGTKHFPFFKAFGAGAVTMVQNLKEIIVFLFSFIAHAFSLTADLSSVAGPVGIASVTGEAARLGVGALLSFAALLSLNLAVINFLPFPALDGGRLFFLLLEALFRRPIPPRFAHAVNTLGFSLLIVLMLVVTFHDVTRLIG